MEPRRESAPAISRVARVSLGTFAQTGAAVGGAPGQLRGVPPHSRGLRATAATLACATGPHTAANGPARRPSSSTSGTQHPTLALSRTSTGSLGRRRGDAGGPGRGRLATPSTCQPPIRHAAPPNDHHLHPCGERTRFSIAQALGQASRICPARRPSASSVRLGAENVSRSGTVSKSGAGASTRLRAAVHHPASQWISAGSGSSPPYHGNSAPRSKHPRATSPHSRIAFATSLLAGSSTQASEQKSASDGRPAISGPTDRCSAVLSSAGRSGSIPHTNALSVLHTPGLSSSAADGQPSRRPPHHYGQFAADPASAHWRCGASHHDTNGIIGRRPCDIRGS